MIPIGYTQIVDDAPVGAAISWRVEAIEIDKTPRGWTVYSVDGSRNWNGRSLPYSSLVDAIARARVLSAHWGGLPIYAEVAQ